MDYFLILAWFACGILAFSLINAFIRMDCKSLYIEDFFGSDIGNKRSINSMDVLMLLGSTIFGLIHLVRCLMNIKFPLTL